MVKKNVIIKIFVCFIIMLFLCCCITSKKESPTVPKSPQILGGWESLSQNDAEALNYFYKVKEMVTEKKGWKLNSKPYKIAAQIVSGIKYQYFVEAQAFNKSGHAEIIILTDFDNNIKILDCKFISKK